MRVGLCGSLRRVWAPRGVKVRQRIQMERVWRYVALIVDVQRGQLIWRWIETMKGAAIAEAVRDWRDAGVEALVWDNARGHFALEVREVSVTPIHQPPYAPELNPAELVFQQVRRKVEGRVYATIEDKMAAVDESLRQLAANPDQVRHLTRWHWIQDACAQLPQKVIVS